ncbi:hypothetical protein C0J52_13795 [Blattella germanica]|nr:hypothetical protein C0J52_13795 [Blattella germanica]
MEDSRNEEREIWQRGRENRNNRMNTVFTSRELEEERRVFVFRLCTVTYEWRAVEMDPARVSGTLTVEDLRSYIKIETLHDKTPTEIHRALSEVCGKLTVSRSTVK